jgi:D-alanine--D-alanine ligase
MNAPDRHRTTASTSSCCSAGESAEHDVSCTTAAHVLAAADPPDTGSPRSASIATVRGRSPTARPRRSPKGPTAIPARLDPTGTTVAPSPMLAEQPTDPRRTVVLPLLHGPLGEDGTVQGLLELADVPYVGSGVLVVGGLAMDKAMAKQVLAAAGIPQARSRAFADHQRTPGLPAELADDLGLPCFVKPANMGSSVGVTKANDRRGAARRDRPRARVRRVGRGRRGGRGREIEVAVLGNTEPFASAPGEIVPGEEFYSYDDKYVSDGAATARAGTARRRRRRAGVRARRRRLPAAPLRGTRPGRLLLRGAGTLPRGFLCNEVNTMPGFTPISMFPKLWLHAGLTYPELIDRLVDLALDRHARRRRNTHR